MGTEIFWKKGYACLETCNNFKTFTNIGTVLFLSHPIRFIVVNKGGKFSHIYYLFVADLKF
jgi:hypothetical protein